MFDLTKSLEMGRDIVLCYLEDGEQTLKDTLLSYSNAVVENTQEPEMVDTKLQTIIAGVLSVIYENNSEMIIRRQATLSQPFKHIQQPSEKAEIFIKELVAFLKSVSLDEQPELLTEKVKIYLQACQLNELKLLTVSSLSEKLGYNRSYFSRKIKQESGISIQEMITEEKLRRAFNLLTLRKGRVTVKQLSSMVGFSDSAYFSRLFKEKFNVLPSDMSFMK